MRTPFCLVLFAVTLTGCAHVRTPRELATLYEQAHAAKDLPALMALHYTNGVPDRAVRRAARSEQESLSLRVTGVRTGRLLGDTRWWSDAKAFTVDYDTETQTNNSTIVRWSRVIKKVHLKWYLEIPGISDTHCLQSSFTDDEILHYHKRAKEVLNDPRAWERCGVEFKGRFEVASEDFRYDCDPYSAAVPTITVTLELKRKDMFDLGPGIVEITFERDLQDDPDNEIVSMRYNYPL